MHLLGKKTCRWKLVKDAVGKRGGERGSDEIDVVCKIILFKVIERECQESKSESLLDDGRKTKTK